MEKYLKQEEKIIKLELTRLMQNIVILQHAHLNRVLMGCLSMLLRKPIGGHFMISLNNTQLLISAVLEVSEMNLKML